MGNIYKKLGILGGMGPLATYNLYRSIIESTPAKRDQNHIDMVILNASGIPDRTDAITGNGESPLPYLIKECATLEEAGCDIIAMPCNTAHYFYDELQANCGVKILNMIDLAAERLSELNIASVYLMATAGTIKARVYKRYFSKKNINITAANETEISEFMKVIYGLKSGVSPDLSDIAAIAEEHYKTGSEKIILGCTELSLIKDDMTNMLKVNFEAEHNIFVDATEVLKDEILKRFGKIIRD